MPYRLTDLVIDRVDCVDISANQHASILLWKRFEPHEETAPLPIPNEWRGLMSGKTEGQRLYIEDRQSLDEWASALPRGVCIAKGDPDVAYVGTLARVPTVTDSDVRTLASMLPLTCERHVFLCGKNERARLEYVVPVGKTVAWMEHQLSQAVQIRKSLAQDRIAKAKESVMHNLPSDDVIAKSLDGDKTALAACRKGFESLVTVCEHDVSANRLSGKEQNELRFADAGGQMSVAEKGGIVAGLRAPTLYEAYSKAVGQGIASA